MKQTLLPVVAVLTALSLSFTACEDPLSDYTVTNTEVLPELPGPEWVKAEALKGANSITWAFTKDAKGYTVYRQELDANGAEVGGFTEGATKTHATSSLIDAVGLDNQLKNGVSYRYGVTANNAAGLSGRSVDYVQEGVTYADPVTADIPAQGTVVTAIAALTADSITAEGVSDASGSDRLLVSWPYTHPAFSYSVQYAVGNATLSKNLSSSSSPTSGETWYYSAPLFGGSTQVSLVVTFGADAYYYKPATITKAVTGLSLSGPLTVNQMYFNDIKRGGGGTAAIISWYTDPSVPDLGSYKLYRIAATNVTTGYPSSNLIEAVDADWTAVTGGVQSAGSGQVTVIDSGLDPEKGYLYALYAQVGERKSSPVLYGLGVDTDPISGPDFDVKTSYTTAADGTRTYSVTLGWNAAVDATYKLERAPVAYSTDAIGAYTTVTVPVAVGGRYTVVDNPAIRQSYIYRLTATVNGVETVSYTSLDADPFTESVDSQSFYASSSTSTAYAIELGFSPSNYVNDITADIYRAAVPENLLNTWVNTGRYSSDAIEKSAFALIKAGHPVKDGNYTDAAGLVIGTKYVYRVVYKVGAKTLYDSTDETGYVQQPSVPYIPGYSYITDRNAVSGIQYFEISNYYYNILILAGTQVQLQSKATSADAPWSPGNAVLVLKTSNTGSGPTGSGIGADSYYFSFSIPAAAAQTANNYRLVIVDQGGTDGNTGDTSDQASSILYSNTVNNW
jgi:hypothetical protein